MTPRWREERAAALLAVQFLTRLPVADPGFTPARLAASPRWYPAVGIGLGLASGAVLLAASSIWSPVLAALAAVAAGVALTGALHEDGFADLCDGLGGGRTRQRAMEIMRDSRIGAYGALGLGLVLAARVLALAEAAGTGAGAGVATLVAAQAASRGGIVALLAALPYARPDGAASGIAAPGPRGLAFALGIGLASVVPLAILSPGAAAAGLAGLVLGWGAVLALLRRRLGGYTGDGLGAVQVACDVGLCLGVAAWL